MDSSQARDYRPTSAIVQLGEHEEVEANQPKSKHEKDETLKLPGIPSLDFQSLQNCFEFGSVLLDVKENDFQKLLTRIAEQMIYDGQVKEAERISLIKIFQLNQPITEVAMLSQATHRATVPKTVNVERIGSNQNVSSKSVKTETALVMVQSADFLQKAAIGFVRLATACYFPEKVDNESPVRFVFIFLGPAQESLDYSAIRNGICAILSNNSFGLQAYQSKSKTDLSVALENFFTSTQGVAPSRSWGMKTLVDLIKRRNSDVCQPKKVHTFNGKERFEEEHNSLLNGKVSNNKSLVNPLEKTHRLWGGLINDVSRRMPQYKSDIIDGLNRETIAASIFLFFGVLSTVITFGGLMSEKTKNLMGISETLLSTSLVGIVFHLFSSQPLIIVGGTGPLLLFDEALFQFCQSNNLDFLTVRIYIGLWIGLIALGIAAFDGCVYLRLFTRFTQELFASLISLIFMMEAVFKVIDVYKAHPVLAEYDSCHSNITASSQEMPLDQLQNITMRASSQCRIISQPNTALFCTILSIGTFVLAYTLRVFRNSHFLGRSMRRAIGDFGVPISIATFVCLSYFVPQIYTDKLNVPEGISPTDPTQREWIIHFNAVPIWVPFAAVVAALLVYVLIFMETQISELILDKPERGLKKGPGFHVDIVIICLMNAIFGFLGMPWQSGATVRSVTHVSAVTVISQNKVLGDKSQILRVNEQRISGLLICLMVGLSVTMTSLLKLIPMSVLYGVFFYMGISSISGIQFLHRIRLLFTPIKYHGNQVYVTKVRTWKMHIFTFVQIVALCALWTVKSSRISLALPFVLVLMLPLRQKMSSYFSRVEIAALDGNLPEIDVDDEPDFYEQSHLPV